MEQLDASDPRRVGPYVLLLPLGSGGMGKVYLGRSAAGRAVAVKVIRADFAADEHFRNRFRAEVAAARRVSGAFTAPVVDADPDGDPPWMATAFVSGLSLYDAVRRHGPLPEASLRMLLAGVSEALVGIHTAGVIHRDLKPGNVLLALDGPHVIDFGIAHALDGTSFTREGTIVGSPGYMSPEQSLGRPVSAASDVFALGSTMLYAASGQRPFGDGPPAAVLRRVVGDPADVGALPASIRDVVAACLHKDPVRRPTPRALIDFVSRDEGGSGGGSWLPDAVTRDVSRAADVLTGLPAARDAASGHQAPPTTGMDAPAPARAPAGSGTPTRSGASATPETSASAESPALPGTAASPGTCPPPDTSASPGIAAPPGTSAPPGASALPWTGSPLGASARPDSPRPPEQARQQLLRRRLFLGLAAGAAVSVSGGVAAVLLPGDADSARGAVATPSAGGPASSPPATVPAPPPVAPHAPLPAPTGRNGVLDGPPAATSWTVKASGPVTDVAVYGGSVIATSKNGRDAFDAGAGRPRWTLPLTGSWSDAGRVAGDDRVAYLTGTKAAGQDVLSAVQPGTGRELWTLPLPHVEWAPTGVAGVVDDIAFVTGRGITGKTTTLSSFGFVWAVDVRTRTGVWETVGADVDGLFVPPRGPNLLSHGDRDRGSDGRLVMLDATRAGARGWTIDVPPVSTQGYVPVTRPPIPVCWTAGGFVYCADRVRLVEPERGKPVWDFPAAGAGETFTDCASNTDGDTVFATTQTTLYCLDARKGTLRWRSSIPGDSAKRPTFGTQGPMVRYDFGNVYVADSTGTLWAVEAATGTTRWKHPFPVQPPGDRAGPLLTAAAGIVVIGYGFQLTTIDAAG
ncbi:protein kinase domain-containing protein [Embleya sp. MST-111070]|uniref:protein kinase domain-containing protein n=1 Tax=Embleya sp. MST-111070 TaxID=3398231 RepID=UPI003F732E27